MKPRPVNYASQEHTEIDLNSARPLVLTRHIISDGEEDWVKEEENEEEGKGKRRKKRKEPRSGDGE